MLSNTRNETIRRRQILSMSLTIIFLMISSPLLALVQPDNGEQALEITDNLSVQGIASADKAATKAAKAAGLVNKNTLVQTDTLALTDLMWSDAGVSSGIILDFLFWNR